MAFAALGDARRAWELFTLINPVSHALTREDAQKYKVEPYVVAADVYAAQTHVGRGGWTWYTGSAGWMYRLLLESLCGVRREGEALRFQPCLPSHWPSLTVHYRYRGTPYLIRITQLPGTDGAQRVLGVQVDGVEQHGPSAPLVDDGREHYVEVRVAAGASPPAADPAA
jgi:cellobiose phosphorylase